MPYKIVTSDMMWYQEVLLVVEEDPHKRTSLASDLENIDFRRSLGVLASAELIPKTLALLWPTSDLSCSI